MQIDLNQLTDIFVDTNDFDVLDDDTTFSYTPFIKTIPVQRIETGESNQNKALCKVLNRQAIAKDPYQQLSIIREVINLNQLKHPAIAAFQGFNIYNDKINYDENGEEEEEDGIEPVNTSPTLFLEYVDYSPLKNFINKSPSSVDRKFNSTKKMICILGLSSAVLYLHKRNILHRNLNPTVIWLDSNYYPKIVDLSTSRQFSKDAQSSIISQTLMQNSNELYSAYEIEDGLFGSPVDIFSLARIIYAILSGIDPFSDRRDYKTHKFIDQMIKTPLYPNFSSGGRDLIPPQYRDLLQQCWAKNPNSRPTADEFFSELVEDLEKYKIDDTVDMAEVEAYVRLLQASDSSEKQLQITATFDAYVDLPLISNSSSSTTASSSTSIPTDSATILQELRYIVNTKFASITSNPKYPLQLLQQYIQTGETIPLDIIAKTSDYVFRAFTKGEPIAKSFINSFYGQPVVSEGLVTINDGAVANDQITVAQIPKSVKQIGARAFAGFKQLKYVFIPANVRKIEEQAFAECPKLTFVFIPKQGSLTTIEPRAFYNCPLLDYFTFPDQIKAVPKHVFENDSKLSHVDLNKVQTIDKMAFKNCESLSHITFPATLETVGYQAFAKTNRNLQVDYKRPKKEINFGKKVFARAFL